MIKKYIFIVILIFAIFLIFLNYAFLSDLSPDLKNKTLIKKTNSNTVAASNSYTECKDTGASVFFPFSMIASSCKEKNNLLNSVTKSVDLKSTEINNTENNKYHEKIEDKIPKIMLSIDSAQKCLTSLTKDNMSQCIKEISKIPESFKNLSDLSDQGSVDAKYEIAKIVLQAQFGEASVIETSMKNIKIMKDMNQEQKIQIAMDLLRLAAAQGHAKAMTEIKEYEGGFKEEVQQ